MRVRDSSVRWGWRYQTRILSFLNENLIQPQKAGTNKLKKQDKSVFFLGGGRGMRCFFCLLDFAVFFCWTRSSLLSSHTVEVTKELWRCNCKSPERIPFLVNKCYGKNNSSMLRGYVYIIIYIYLDRCVYMYVYIYIVYRYVYIVYKYLVL